MHLFSKKAIPRRITCLECTGCSGFIYRVVGRGVPPALRYSIEVERSGTTSRSVLPDFTADPVQANTLALRLLDAEATPADLEQMALGMTAIS